jgi:hypothetical protein
MGNAKTARTASATERSKRRFEADKLQSLAVGLSRRAALAGEPPARGVSVERGNGGEETALDSSVRGYKDIVIDLNGTIQT